MRVLQMQHLGLATSRGRLEPPQLQYTPMQPGARCSCSLSRTLTEEDGVREASAHELHAPLSSVL